MSDGQIKTVSMTPNHNLGLELYGFNWDSNLNLFSISLRALLRYKLRNVNLMAKIIFQHFYRHYQ